jgi:hypothetical protein
VLPARLRLALVAFSLCAVAAGIGATLVVGVLALQLRGGTPSPPADPVASDAPAGDAPAGTRLAGAGEGAVAETPEAAAPAPDSSASSAPAASAARPESGSERRPTGTEAAEPPAASEPASRPQPRTQAPATPLLGGAVPSSAAAPPPAATPTNPTVNPGPTDAAAVAAQIAPILRGFVGSLESRSVQRIRSAYPGAAGPWLEQWSPFLQDRRNVRDLKAQLPDAGTPEVSGNTARVSFQVLFEYVDFRNDHQTQRTTFNAVFRRDAASGQWALAQLSPEG